jgi:hypothetical protein
MELRGRRIEFNKCELDLCGLEFILVNEAIATAAALYRHSEQLYKNACAPSSEADSPLENMIIFNRAGDVRQMAEKLEDFAPELAAGNITALIGGLEELLGKQAS